MPAIVISDFKIKQKYCIKQNHSFVNSLIQILGQFLTDVDYIYKFRISYLLLKVDNDTEGPIF